MPWRVEHVTSENLSKMLRASGTICAATTATLTATEGLGENQDGAAGVLSRIWRLSVSYEGPTPGPATMMLKTMMMAPAPHHHWKHEARPSRWMASTRFCASAPLLHCFCASARPSLGSIGF